MGTGPLRIVRRPKAYGAPTAETKIKDYFLKLASVAPAEVTGFYLTFRPVVVGTFTAQQIREDALARWYPWIAVVLVVFVKLWATHQDRWWRGQWKAVFISTFAFILWVVTMGHYMAIIGDWGWLKDPRYTAVLAGVFTFVLPYIYSGDPPPAPRPAARTEAQAPGSST